MYNMDCLHFAQSNRPQRGRNLAVRQVFPCYSGQLVRRQNGNII